MNPDEFSSHILFEDEDLIVINKPLGVPSQEDLTGDPSILRSYEQVYSRTGYLVNRIDRPVSGCLVLAKSVHSYNELIQKKITKKYIAIIHDQIPQREGRLTHFIRRNGKKKKAAVRETQKEGFKVCSLEYETIMNFERYQGILVIPLTGRFHQIRAQLSFIGHPIKGDVKYGARRSNKGRAIDLHAHSIDIPGKVQIDFASSKREDNLWLEIEKKYGQ